MIAFSCPHCDAELEVPDSRAGATVKCPECEERFTVPTRGKRGPAAREREPERRSRPAPASRGGRSPARSEREERSKQGMGLILACVGGAAVLGLGMIIAVVMLLRASKEEPRVEHPQAVSQPIARVNPPPQQTPPADAKPPEVKVQEPLPGAELPGNADSGQTVYKHLLKSAAWIVVVVDSNTALMGSGSLIDRKNRLLITNAHVVGDNNQILVFFPTYRDGKLVAERDLYMKQTRREDLNLGKVLDKDVRRDLALVQLDRVPDGIEALPVAKRSTGPGETVHSIGNPGSSGGLWVYTSGTVRQVYHYQWGTTDGGSHEAQIVETQNPTNHGDSGGPLVNARGELVGVTQGGSSAAQLVSIFIDVTEATDFIQRACQKSGLAWAREESRMIIAGNAAGVPGLIRNLESPDSKVRGNTAQALGNVGAEARMAVGPLLALLAKENDDLTRKLAVEALNKIGPPEKADLTALTTALQDLHPELRSYAARALGQLGADARPAVPALLKAARDRESSVRQSVVRALGNFGTEAKDAILQVIAEALKDSDRDTRRAAGDALASLGVLGVNELPMVRDLLKHQDTEIRSSAARALGQMGKAAKPAVPALVAAFKDSDKSVRKPVVEALAVIGGSPKELVPILAEVVTDTDKALSKSAALALAKFGADAKEAAPALATVLSDPDKELRKSAAVALGKMGADAKSAVSALADCLKDEDRDFRLQVIATLGAIGPDAKAAVPALIQVFESREKDMHRKCALAIGKIGKDAVKPLVIALSHENFLIRIGAAMSLGEIGPPAKKDASKALLAHAQNDLDPQVRQVAASALAKVMAKP
jgi:predicted Zn finger-like uncharacterized protein